MLVGAIILTGKQDVYSYFQNIRQQLWLLAFVLRLYLEAYEITKNEDVLKETLSAANFVMNDLKERHMVIGFFFSYSVKDGNNTVINASFLGAKILSLCLQVFRK